MINLIYKRGCPQITRKELEAYFIKIFSEIVF